MRRVPETNSFPTYRDRPMWISYLASWRWRFIYTLLSWLVSNTSHKIIKGSLGFVDQENVPKWCEEHRVTMTLTTSVVIDSVVKDATLKRVIGCLLLPGLMANFTLNYQQYGVLTVYLQIQVTEATAKRTWKTSKSSKSTRQNLCSCNKRSATEASYTRTSFFSLWFDENQK